LNFYFGATRKYSSKLLKKQEASWNTKILLIWKWEVSRLKGEKSNARTTMFDRRQSDVISFRKTRFFPKYCNWNRYFFKDKNCTKSLRKTVINDFQKLKLQKIDRRGSSVSTHFPFEINALHFNGLKPRNHIDYRYFS
jgi:hypothetical protein